jgi:hypothetical protein
MSELLQRRQFIRDSGLSLGGIALASLMGDAKALTHFAPKAKRVIYLFMHGGPSQLDLFDHKPGLKKLHGQEIPASVVGDQRLTGMTSSQKSKPVTASMFNFARHGQSGAWVSELLPHTAKMADELCIIRSMHTEAINHDPAVTFLQTGHQQPGRPSFGAWLSYGLGMRKPRPAGLRRAGITRQRRTTPPIRSMRGCGARAFCRRIIKASPSAAAAIRFYICRIPKASMPRHDAISSMSSPH